MPTLPSLSDPRSAARQRLSAVVAAHPRGLLTDVDGTISAIAPTPDAAVLLPGVRELLADACATFEVVAAISGRSALDARRLVGIPEMLYVGNHGLEILAPARQSGDEEQLTIVPEALPYVAQIEVLLNEIARDVAPRFEGMLVEHKGVTGSIHYRLVHDRTAAEAAILAELAHLGANQRLRVTHGKQVIELRPPLDIDKGSAVQSLVSDHHLRGAIYLGDDRTDLDAFQSLRSLATDGTVEGCTVAVAHPEAPPELAAAADLVLDSITHVPDFLREVLALAV